MELLAPLAEGVPLHEALLISPLSTEHHTVAIEVDRSQAVQGDLLPGDILDVYVTDDASTRLLAESVLVIASDTPSGFTPDSTVALLVAADRALARLRGRGRPRLRSTRMAAPARRRAAAAPIAQPRPDGADPGGSGAVTRSRSRSSGERSRRAATRISIPRANASA